jgi:protein-S-isoprenylcysteine O-methyltransferase Ste14
MDIIYTDELLRFFFLFSKLQLPYESRINKGRNGVNEGGNFNIHTCSWLPIHNLHLEDNSIRTVFSIKFIDHCNWGNLICLSCVWAARKIVDGRPTPEYLAWTTSILHITLMILFGVSIIEAIKFFQIELGVVIPLPIELGIMLLLITGTAAGLTAVNLALSGLGAPFAIALSKRVANRWMYRWTRNPMVFCTLAALLSAGIYFQSLYFILWVILLPAPSWIYFLKVYEERELEIRFGTSYLEYKAKTPFLWPGKPKA